LGAEDFLALAVGLGARFEGEGPGRMGRGGTPTGAKDGTIGGVAVVMRMGGGWAADARELLLASGVGVGADVEIAGGGGCGRG